MSSTIVTIDTAVDGSVPPSRRQVVLANVLTCLFVGLAALLTPIANLALPVAAGYIPSFCAAMLVINLMLCAILFNRAKAEASPASRALAETYFFVALMFLPFIFSFPGAWSENLLFGRPGTVVWIWTLWHAGLGLGMIRYSIIASRKVGKDYGLTQSIFAVVLLVVLVSWISSEGQAYLPTVISSNDRTLFRGEGKWVPFGVMVILIVALWRLVRLPNPSVEQLWLRVSIAAACFDVWLTFWGIDRYTFGWYFAKIGSLTTSLVIMLSLFLDNARMYRLLAKANRTLGVLANQDGLTALGNRRCFNDVLNKEWARAQRTGSPISLLMMDVDWFKQYNDRYGHLGGDECLKHVADALRASVFRPTDLMARYGGEEFAVILPDTSAEGAVATAKRILDRLGALALPHADSPLGRVSLSIGVASVVPASAQGVETLIGDADKALYEAKRTGRNTVHLAPMPA